jgi:hypothetical protein
MSGRCLLQGYFPTLSCCQAATHKRASERSGSLGRGEAFVDAMQKLGQARQFVPREGCKNRTDRELLWSNSLALLHRRTALWLIGDFEHDRHPPRAAARALQAAFKLVQREKLAARPHGASACRARSRSRIGPGCGRDRILVRARARNSAPARASRASRPLRGFVPP